MIAAGNRVMIKPSELVPHFAALLKELVAQGAVVFIMTMVQGWGPPSSIIPGIERFAGIAGGLLIVHMVAVLFAPAAVSTGETHQGVCS